MKHYAALSRVLWVEGTLAKPVVRQLRAYPRDMSILFFCRLGDSGIIALR